MLASLGACDLLSMSECKIKPVNKCLPVERCSAVCSEASPEACLMLHTLQSGLVPYAALVPALVAHRAVLHAVLANVLIPLQLEQLHLLYQ